jgi:hypothetical protein
MQVFISHADEDSYAAAVIAERLRQAGIAVWHSEEILPGENWARKVGEALDASNAMVVLVSPHAVNSPWVQREIAYAVGSSQYAGRLIPVIIEPTADVPWVLRRMSAIDDAHDFEQASKDIIERLQQPVG